MMTKWTDTYCTITEADADGNLLINFNWNSLPDDQKENYLKTASQNIDDLNFRGKKKSETQKMKFPRDIPAGNFSSWQVDDSEIEKELIRATSAQVAYLLSPLQAPKQEGGAEFSNKLCVKSYTNLIPYVIMSNYSDGWK